MAMAMTARPSAPRKSPCVIAIRARVDAAHPRASRPTKVIEPSPRKSSASAFSAWLLAMNPPTISRRPKPTLRMTTHHSARRYAGSVWARLGSPVQPQPSDSFASIAAPYNLQPLEDQAPFCECVAINSGRA